MITALRGDWFAVRSHISCSIRGRLVGCVKKLKICHVNLASGYRGGERQTWLLLLECIKRYGARNAALVCRRGYRLESLANSIPGLLVVAVDTQLAGHFLVKAFRPNIVHAHDARAVYWAFLHHKLFKAPFIITRRVQNPLKDKVLMRLAYCSASHVVSISEAVHRAVEKIRPDSTIVRSTVAPHNDIFYGGERWPKSILVAGALDERTKGQSVMISALSLLPDEWTLRIIGDGPDLPLFQSLVASLGLSHRVEFEAWNDKIALEAMYSSEYFVMPSNHEGLGTILLDAMRAGCVVIATEVGGIPELIIDGQTGYLIPPRNQYALADKLTTADSHPKWKNKVRKNAIEYAQYFSPENMMASYETIYQRILDGRANI
jgi:glycosyltransferase involved in cell wall biosynthesis